MESQNPLPGQNPFFSFCRGITKRSFLLVFLFILIVGGNKVYAQKYWVGGANGAFSVAANWSASVGGAGGIGIPVAGDQLVFDGTDIDDDPGLQTDAVTVTNISTLSLKSITISNSSDVTFAAAGPVILTLGPAVAPPSDALVISGSTFNISSNITISLLPIGNAVVDATGTFKLTNGSTFNIDATGGGKADVNGTLENAGGTIVAPAGKLRFNANSVYNHTRDGGSIPVATWDPTSTIKVTGIAATQITPFTNDQTFGNFIWNCPLQNISQDIVGNATITVNIKGNLNIIRTGFDALYLVNFVQTPTLTVEGNLVIGDGVNNAQLYTNGSTNNTTVNIGGDLTVNKEGRFQVQIGTTTVNFGINGKSANSNWGGNGTYTNNGISYIIRNQPVGKIVNLNGFSSGIILTVGAVTVNTGATLNCGTQIIGGTGDFTLQAGATLGLGHINGIDGNITTSGTKTYNETGAGTTFNFNSAISGQITGLNLPAAVTNLTISNGVASGVVYLSKSTVVNSTLTLTGGILALQGNDLTLSAGATLAGNPPSVTNMVAPGIGKFYKHFAAPDPTAFTFPIGDLDLVLPALNNYSPVTLDFTSLTADGLVGVGVIDGVHPEMNTGGIPPHYLSRYWHFASTLPGNYIYNVSTYLYDAGDITGTEANMKLSFWNGSAWSIIANSTAAGNILSIPVASPLSNISGPLNGNVFTGRSETCSSDTEPPTIVCPPDVTANTSDDGTGDCETTVVTGIPTVADNCVVDDVIAQIGGVTINPVTYKFPSGITTITWIVTDLAGNSANCNQTITVLDDEDPVITCVDVTRNTSDDGAGNCTTTSPAIPANSDNCIGSTVAATVGGVPIDPGTYLFSLGTTSVTWTITDAAGNSATCNQQVTVVDNEDPTITCPVDVTVPMAPGVCTSKAVLGVPLTSDNCSIASTVAQAGGITIDPATYDFPAGTTIVTWIVTDGSGRTASCDQDVTVSDDEDPIITCPADVTAATSDDGGNNCSTTVALGVAGVTDNCAGFTVIAQVGGVTIDPATYLFPTGITVVTWIATDADSNTATCTQNVTVTDDEPPVAISRNYTAVLDAFGNASITTADVNNSSTDNCGIVSMTAVPNTFTIANLGPNTVTLTVTDAAGLSDTDDCTVTVTGVPPTAYYSYQTGTWDDPNTWTSDPGGTTGPGTTIPGDNDVVVILTGRTVTLDANVPSTNLDLTINSGGILDLSTYAFTGAGGLSSLAGGGILKLSSPDFPVAATNTFVTTDGGTTEYNHNGEMSSVQSIYYNVIIRSSGTVTQKNNVTINGNLEIKQGTFRINDATSQRLQLIINGDVTVENGCSMTVGTGVTNSTTNPRGINGVTGGFVNYYELQSHRVQIYGNFTNDGTVRFTNLAYPVYNFFPPIAAGPTTGFATVYFNGAADKTLLCNGQTDFYNIVVDKGTDQTYKLTVNSAAYGNFRLYGANNSEGEVVAPATDANPLLKKALWIRNGTLELTGLVIIPSLTEGATAGPPSSDFTIPANGALLMNGGGVIILVSADDFREVNGAYGVAAPDNGSMGINTGGGSSALSVMGKIEVNDGYLSTRESSGILYWPYASGQFILNGGFVDTKQFHGATANTSLVSYTQTGGMLEIRGRFKRTPNTFDINGIKNPPLITSRVANGISAAAGSFSITNSGGATAFSMSNGTIRILDVCGTGATQLAFQVLCAPAGINVTGGTVDIRPTTGTVLADANHFINTTAPVYNLNINRQPADTASVRLNTNPLSVLNNLNLTNGVFISSNLNLTVGGNFSLAAGTQYKPWTNTTTFNGTGNQTLTANIAAPLAFSKLTIDKPASTSLDLAGTQPVINVAGDFRLVAATLNDNGKTINLARNAFNSGVHAGAGRIVMSGNVAQSIDGNGNGVFQNLELNNASAPVSMIANTTVNGNLTFSQDQVFNIQTFNLKLNANATIVNSGALRYIRSSGNSGDGGLTKDFTVSNSFTFPIGVGNYTPGSIILTGSPTTRGNITIVPVNFEHPNVTAFGRSISYFWRTKSSGFVLGPATATHEYVYDQSNVITGGDVAEDGYVPGRFYLPTNSWTKGIASEVDESSNKIGGAGSGTFLVNTNFIDGDYTAGDDDATSPFGTPSIYYSRINGAGTGSGLWNDVSSWSTDGVAQHTGAPAGTVPGGSDIVIIGGRDSIYLSNEAFPLPSNIDPPVTYFQLDKAVVNCATLRIEKGSCLDIQNNPGSNFGMVLSHPNGNGNLRVTTRHPITFDTPYTYVFPGGDFSDFNVNNGTTEFYGINPQISTVTFMPLNANSYGTVILSPLRESNISLPNINSVTIYGDLITRGSNWESWLAMTWNIAAYGAIVPKTVTVRGDLLIQGGSFLFMGNGNIQQTISIDGDVVVYPGAGIDIWAPSTASKMAIGGSLINNSNDIPGIIAPWAGSRVRFYVTNSQKIDVEFFGSNNAFITNTIPAVGNVPYTTFGKVTVNKGNSPATTLTCNVGGLLSTNGTLASPNDNWLTLQNGTLIYQRTGDFNITDSSQFTISTTAGLTINTPSNVYIGSGAVNNNDLILNGKLTIINGNVFVGASSGINVNNNDIEYTSSGASALDIQGGTLFVNGQIRRNPLNAGGVLKYSQSGGSVTINGQASNATNAKLEVLNAGSNFTMSNGILTIVRGNGTLITPSTPFGDLYLRPQTGSVTGGTILFSHGGTGEQNYFLDATIPVNNLTISDAAGLPSALRILTSPLAVNGNMTINANCVLNSNNVNITFRGNLINTPGLAGYIYGTNLTTFNARNKPPFNGIQTITGITDFYDLNVKPGTSLTLSDPSTINRHLAIDSGIFVLGDNPVHIKGNLINNASYTDDNNPGSGIILDGSAQQQISGTGAYARLTINNAAGATLENSITLSEDLTMTSGIFDIKKYLLTLGTNSLIQGGPFSAAKMISSDGVFSDVGLRKFFNAGAIDFLYPIGTSGKYTPAHFVASASATVGSLRVNNINSRHPAVLDPAKVLDYYWEVQSSGLTGLTGSVELNYYQEDVAGDESLYLAARLSIPGSTWATYPGVDQAVNKITTNYAASNNLSGEYTAGLIEAFYDDVPEFTSNKNGNWTDKTIWTQTGGDLLPECPDGGPNGFIVNINHVVDLNADYCYAYRTTINNRLNIPATHFGHNLGTVYGSGRLYLEKGAFPAGVFTTFLDCTNNATVEYGGNGTYTIVADLFDNISNIIFSGTGTRVLPNKDLTICNRLLIDGSTGVTLDNSVFNKKLTILGTIERTGTGIFKSGSGAGATVTFAGTGLQTVGGATSLGNFTGTSAFNNLEINNSSGLRIDDDGGGAIEVKGNLLLTEGLINTGPGRTLTIINSGMNCVIPAGGKATSFIDGPLTKRISQYDSFLYPVGIDLSGLRVLGNRIRISSTQSGPDLWTVQYNRPNHDDDQFTPPLLGVSSLESYTITSAAGKQAKVSINWSPTTDVNPVVTGGMGNIRVAWFDTGTGKWVGATTTSAGDNNNGTATTTDLMTFTGVDEYTLGSITTLIPRAQFTPTGPVCGSSGIPVTFTALGAIPFNYQLTYTVNGAARPSVPVTPADMPFMLDTDGDPGIYQLTGFTYNNGTGTGVVDATTVTVNPDPTVSDAGDDQALCGTTVAILDGNDPAPFTGLWSIQSGSGGTILTPMNRASQFNGLNGSSYTLRWTISSGSCTSFDDVVISFPIQPDAPVAAGAQTLCGPSTIEDIAATAPVGCNIDWYGNEFDISPLAAGTSLVSGLTYWAESVGGTCRSLNRTSVTITINPIPSPGLVGPLSVCIGSTGNRYDTEAGKSNYVWTFTGGNRTAGGLSTDSFIEVTWTSDPGTVSINYTEGGCTAAAPSTVTVTVKDEPTITLGTDPSVCQGSLTTNLTYTGTTGSPNRYSLVYDDPAFTDRINVVLAGSPIGLNIPAGTPVGVYTATLTVWNNVDMCISGSYPVSITVTTLPQGTLTANGPFCGTGAGMLTWTATSGTGPYTVIYNDGTANRTANGVVSGVPFAVFTTPVTSTTTYTLVSVEDATTCIRSAGFTGGAATITVNPQPQGSLASNGPFCITGAGMLTWTATSGTGPYTVIYNDGTADRTENGVVSGTPFAVFTTPVTSTTTYTLVSVEDATTCIRSAGFTGGAATITVNPQPQGSLASNGPFCITGAGMLTWTATSGTGPYTVIYNDGTYS